MAEQGSGTNMGSDGFGRWMIGLMILYALGIVIVFFWVFTHPASAVETELTAIQSVIENLPNYQEEIENWGYQVFVLPQDAEAVGYRDYDALYFHYDASDTALILKDADGGMYCFDYGFDRYVSKRTCPERVQEEYGGGYTDTLRTVELSVAKRTQHQAPYQENTNKPGTRNYYDMYVSVEIELFSVEDGKQLFFGGWGIYSTYYCSNNFVDHRWFGQSLHHTNEWISQRADSRIKQEYSAEELLAFYRQGIALQEKLIELYHNTVSSAA